MGHLIASPSTGDAEQIPATAAVLIFMGCWMSPDWYAILPVSMRHKIVKILLDGRFHSGPEMGRILGISRAAVCKGIRALCEAGLDVHRVTGRGYRLAPSVRPLDERRIRRYLFQFMGHSPAGLSILYEVDSTNRYLLQKANGGTRRGAVCLAETQSRGRGRRDRSWVASPFSNIMLSMAWHFDAGPSIVSGLSLAAGVAVARALQDCGVTGVGLKWPNDVMWRERKLAGLLVDVRGEAAGPCLVVLGLGINVHIAAADESRIDQPWVDLETVTGSPVDRNRLAALMIGHLWRMFHAFERHGLDAFHDDWERLHIYAGQRVRVVTPDGALWGHALGTDAAGALLLLDDHGHTRHFLCGEISLRAVS